MIKVPKSFKIYGNTWTIKRVGSDKLEDAYGIADLESREIWIDKDLFKGKPELLEEVVIHEVTHAAFMEASLYQVKNFTDDVEELICDMVAKLVVNVLHKYFYKVK